MKNDNIIRVQNVSKLYGINKNEAIGLIKKGVDKETIHKKNWRHCSSLGRVL